MADDSKVDWVALSEIHEAEGLLSKEPDLAAMAQALRNLIKAVRSLHADRLTTEEDAAREEAWRNG